MRFLIVPVLTLTMVAATGQAFASGDDTAIDAPRDQWLTIEQVTAKFTSEGYDVRQVKEEDGGYELYAIKDGERVEAFVHPVTGKLLRSETGEDE
jgi:hypothetical protein